MALQAGGRIRELGRLCRDDRQLGLRELGGVGRRTERGLELVPARDAQAVLVERPRVLLAAAEDADLADACQVAGVEAADDPAADYADALDSVLRIASIPRAASSRGSSFQSESGSSRSEKISRS